MLRPSLILLAKDPFKVLGLTRAATKVEVKAKYRELAKQYHPDNSASGDAKTMEEVNRAYNLLLKEGAFERLHTRTAVLGAMRPNSRPSPLGAGAADVRSTGSDIGGVPGGNNVEEAAGASAGSGRRAPKPFEDSSMETDSASFAMSGLNPETERLTPEGKYMYQNSDTGEWMQLDQPLIRTERRQYGSFAKKKTDEVYQEIREMMAKTEEMQRKRTASDKIRDRFADGGNLPSTDMRILALFLLVIIAAVFLAARRTFLYPTIKRIKRDWYGKLRDNKVSFDELYDEAKLDVELSVVAATLIFLAAAKKKSVDDAVVKPAPESFYNETIAPRSHFAVVSGV
jgi:curved DNA-binding protein CbpA